MVNLKCMFVDSSTGYIGPPKYFHSHVKQLLIFEDVLQSLLNMCLCVVCSLILIDPHTDQI